MEGIGGDWGWKIYTYVEEGEDALGKGIGLLLLGVDVGSAKEIFFYSLILGIWSLGLRKL